MVLVLAGRRPDPDAAVDVRFPIANIVAVRERIRAFMKRTGARALVCSAACGADLLALDVAGDLRIERHVVLPFDRARFRETSVVDRPGGWGPLFDRIVDEVEADAHLKTLHANGTDDEAYAQANEELFRHATFLAQGEGVCAVAVWEGSSRGEDDLTEDLLTFAKAARESTATILTC